MRTGWIPLSCDTRGQSPHSFAGNHRAGFAGGRESIKHDSTGLATHQGTKAAGIVSRFCSGSAECRFVRAFRTLLDADTCACDSTAADRGSHTTTRRPDAVFLRFRHVPAGHSLVVFQPACVWPRADSACVAVDGLAGGDHGRLFRDHGISVEPVFYPTQRNALDSCVSGNLGFAGMDSWLDVVRLSVVRAGLFADRWHAVHLCTTRGCIRRFTGGLHAGRQCCHADL